MSSNAEKPRVQRKKPEKKPDLSTHYHKIGIKALAAAAHDETSRSGAPSGVQEQRKRAKKVLPKAARTSR